MVTVVSLPMTLKHTWLTTSGTTGFTLAGMMEEPSLQFRQVDLVQAGTWTREQAQVITDFGHLHSQAFQRAVNHNISAAVRGRFDQVFSRYAWEASDFSQFFHCQRRVLFRRVQTSTDCCCAKVNFQQQLFQRYVGSVPLLLSAGC